MAFDASACVAYTALTMSNEYTATVTAKGSKFLHKVYNPDGSLLGKRLSTRTFAEVALVRNIREREIKWKTESADRIEREDVTYFLGKQDEANAQRCRDRAKELRENAANLPNPMPVYIGCYTNTHKADTRFCELVGFVAFKQDL